MRLLRARPRSNLQRRHLHAGQRADQSSGLRSSGPDTDTHADSDADAHAYAHANSDAYAYAYAYANSDAYGYAHAHAHANSDAYAHANSDSDSDAYAYAYAKANPHAYADCTSGTHSDPDGNAVADAVSGRPGRIRAGDRGRRRDAKWNRRGTDSRWPGTGQHGVACARTKTAPLRSASAFASGSRRR